MSRLVALVVATLVLAVPATATADAENLGPPEGSPAADRQRAAEVLDDRRFKGARLPQPLAIERGR